MTYCVFTLIFIYLLIRLVTEDFQQNFHTPPPFNLLLFLLCRFLLAGWGLGGLGRLRFVRRGLRGRQGLLGLLRVGGEGGRAAGDVDVLSVVRHVLEGELRAVAGAQTHGARSQSVGRLAHLISSGHQCLELLGLSGGVGPRSCSHGNLRSGSSPAGSRSLVLSETPVSVGRLLLCISSFSIQRTDSCTVCDDLQP